MKKLFKTKYGDLIFSLFSGLAYFGVIMNFVLESVGKKGILLAFFFFPAIVCGAGVVLLKSIRRLTEKEDFSKIRMIFVLHVLLAVISVVMLLARV